jgi:iron complex transport system ATP-binding protein
LAQEPELLLLDEPTSNLDLRHQLEVLELVTAMTKEKGISAIVAIHDLNMASRFSSKIVFLKRGKIYAAGEPGTVLTPENIKAVYGVDVLVNEDSGRPHIVPIAVAVPT